MVETSYGPPSVSSPGDRCKHRHEGHGQLYKICKYIIHVESRSGAVAEAPFPLPAHRTGRAVFRHPALGQELMLSPTESSSGGRSSEPGPARRAGSHDTTPTKVGWLVPVLEGGFSRETCQLSDTLGRMTHARSSGLAPRAWFET